VLIGNSIVCLLDGKNVLKAASRMAISGICLVTAGFCGDSSGAIPTLRTRLLKYPRIGRPSSAFCCSMPARDQVLHRNCVIALVKNDQAGLCGVSITLSFDICHRTT
jgi:hypothetical protein